MTTVDLLYRYATPPTETATSALARIREVYGIRRIQIDPAARTLLVEYDATRLSAPTITNLIRSAGLLAVEQPLPPPAPVTGGEAASQA